VGNPGKIKKPVKPSINKEWISQLTSSVWLTSIKCRPGSGIKIYNLMFCRQVRRAHLPKGLRDTKHKLKEVTRVVENEELHLVLLALEHMAPFPNFNHSEFLILCFPKIMYFTDCFQQWKSRKSKEVQ
jgi:hypothetical protein